MARVIADCREFPSEKKCTLTISGELDEVMKAATEHAISTHGHQDSPELREEIKKTLTTELALGGLGIDAMQKKSFKKPDEHRPFMGHGHLDVVELEGGIQMGRAVFEPGWKWSNDVKPLAGTDSCRSTHTGYVLRGRMTIRMDDGTEMTVGPGDAFQIPPGHDAWVEGKTAVELLDVTGFGEYAKRKEEGEWTREEEARPQP